MSKYSKYILDNAYNDLMNEKDLRSMELFDKHYCELSIVEIDKLEKYMYDLSNPIWKPIMIDSKDSGYKISNIGTVKGKRGEIIKAELSNTGYYRINGYMNGKAIKFSIHRKVAIAFISNPENKPFVNHLNGKKTCNWVGNLEWSTPTENMQHAVNTGLMNFKGINHPENVYSEKQIRLACKMLEKPSNRFIDITKKTGINRSILFSIRTGKSWTHISKEYNIPKPQRLKVTNNIKHETSTTIQSYNSNE